MDDINVNFDTDDKKINLDGDTGDASINLKKDENTMLGVELLANQQTSKIDLNVVDDIGDRGGYSSGEDTVKNLKTVNKEDYDFFHDKKEDEIKNDVNETKKVEIPVDDPMINSMKAQENGGFKAIHAMNAQEIKNEKIDLIYKFKKLENQGIRTTMNYNMNSNLEDMRNEYLKLR